MPLFLEGYAPVGWVRGELRWGWGVCWWNEVCIGRVGCVCVWDGMCFGGMRCVWDGMRVGGMVYVVWDVCRTREDGGGGGGEEATTIKACVSGMGRDEIT